MGNENRNMPSRVGCALERRLLRKQFDKLVGLFMDFLAACRLRAGARIGVVNLLHTAIEQCSKDLDSAKRYWNYKSAVGNVPRTNGGFMDD